MTRTDGEGIPRERSVRTEGPVLSVFLVFLVFLVFWSTPAPAQSQVKPSERATVSQTVDGTVMTLDYARPRARGRDPIFGGLVPWGHVWTPGANDATVLELSRGVTIEGQPVPAGRWSVWMVAREEGPWEMVLDPRDDLWHTAHPEETADQIRFPVAAEATDPVETLLWYFPEVRHSGATLVVAWGHVRVPLEVDVEPTERYVMSAEEAAPFLGTWEMQRTAASSPGQARPLEIVHHEDGSVRALSPVAESGRGAIEWVLQPQAQGVFALGRIQYGELWSRSGSFLEMVYEDGVPVSFQVRDSRDRVTWEGRRLRGRPNSGGPLTRDTTAPVSPSPWGTWAQAGCR